MSSLYIVLHTYDGSLAVLSTDQSHLCQSKQEKGKLSSSTTLTPLKASSGKGWETFQSSFSVLKTPCKGFPSLLMPLLGHLQVFRVPVYHLPGQGIVWARRLPAVVGGGSEAFSQRLSIPSIMVSFWALSLGWKLEALF